MRRRTLSPRPGIDLRADELSKRLGALGDPVRMRLLSVLSRGDCPVGLLAEAMGVGQSLVSFHLAALRDAGVVRLEPAGRFTYAGLDLSQIDRLFDDVLELVTVDGGHGASAAPTDHRAVRQALTRLEEPFARLLGATRVKQVVREEMERVRRARKGADVVVDHSRERLRALAQAEGRMPKEVPELLFVCVRNAGRSQIAAGLANLHAQGRVHAWSAGSQPTAEIPAGIVRAMAEMGVNLSTAVPKPITNDLLRSADVVVTMGCGEKCPRFSGVRYVDWAVPDPAEKPLREVRRIRDDLDRRVTALLAEILMG